MGTTRTANLTKMTLAAALGLGSILGLATSAAAETPPAQQEMVLVMPGDTDPQGPTDLAPAPTPDPDPEDDKAPVPLPNPEPETPEGPDEIAQPTGHGDPEPDPDLPIGQPEGEPECDPMLGSCDLTDVPDDEDCNPIQASCDLTSNPGDPGDPGDDDETPEPEVEVEVEGQDADRDALPRTGAGLLMLGAAGTSLTGIGVALRRFARR